MLVHRELLAELSPNPLFGKDRVKKMTIWRNEEVVSERKQQLTGRSGQTIAKA